MKYYIIEHPTRGVFTELDYKVHFSTVASRSDERTEKFFHIAQADRMLQKFPPKLRAQCEIRRNTDWEVVVLVGAVDHRL